MIKEYFSTPVIEELIKINNDDLRQIALDKYRQEEGVTKSNLSGWQSQYVDHLQKQFIPLVGEVLTKSKEITDYFNTGKELNRTLQNMWININPKGGSNRQHNHPGAFISGVYYVNAPENCGPLAIVNPNTNYDYHCNRMNIKEWNSKNAATLIVIPQTGKLVLFPSFASHFVGPNESDELRISISFNIGFDRKVLA